MYPVLTLRVPRRQREPGWLPHSECLLITCLGLLTVTLGAVALLGVSSDFLALSAGIAVIAAGVCFVVFSGLVFVCRAKQSRRRAGLQRLAEETRNESAGGQAETLVIASTRL